MAKCYNCGIEISGGDKTKLCDKCKKILLPFMKFVDASTSSAVRRLVSNERNLRNAGVTDSGMEYLLRLCELHDKKRLMEREAKEAVRNAEPVPEVQQPEVIPEDKFSDIELPADEPLNFLEKPYGEHLLTAAIILLLVATALIVWFIIKIVKFDDIDMIPIAAAVGAAASAYIAIVLRKALSELEEIKKRFK